MKSVFISSTFKDMNAERDLIHESIFPKLRKRLEKYGEDLQELDLRWGVDTSRMTEEESGKQVIETCLNAIDRCRPYMIILLGNRYGWIPPKKIAEAANDTRLSEMNPGELSITQMEIMYYLSLYPEDVPALQDLTAEEFLDRAIGIQEECLGESFEGHPDYTVDWYLYNILQRILKTKDESYFDLHPSVFESFRQKCLKYDSLFQGDTAAYRVSGAAAACRYFLSRENGERALYWAEQLKEGDGPEATKKGTSLLKETERHLLMAAVFLKWGDLREASDRIRKTGQILTSVKDSAAEGGRMSEWEATDGNCRKMDLRLQAIRGGEFSPDAAGDDWIFGLELSALRADAADRTGCPGKAQELRREIFLRYRAGFPDSFSVSQLLSEEPEKVYSLRNCFCSFLKDFFCREMPEEAEYMAEQYCCLYSRCIPGRTEGRNGLLPDDFLRLYDLYWKTFPEGRCVRLRDIQYAVMKWRRKRKSNSTGRPLKDRRSGRASGNTASSSARTTISTQESSCVFCREKTSKQRGPRTEKSARRWPERIIMMPSS